MNLLIIFTATLLVNSRALTINRHHILNDIGNHIKSDDLSRTKLTRNFVSLTRRPEEVILHKRGSIVELTCEGIGAPAPNIRWFKNNHPVYEHDHESNEISYSNPSSLARVTSTLLVVKTRDKDEYTCVISAKSKSARATTVVYSEGDGSDESLERIKLIPREPRILTSYKIFVDTIGNRVVLLCKARAHPRPAIVWRDNKGHTIKNDSHIKALRSGKLVFSALRWSDLGEYTCEATNAFGTQNITTFVYPAKVRDGSDESLERIKLIPREPRILTSYKIFVDTIGNRVVLLCKARAHPRPAIVWRDNKGHTIKNDSHIKALRSGKLVFSALRWSDLGEYTCEATNAFGTQNITTFVYPAKAG